jgi:hypothetical protein
MQSVMDFSNLRVLCHDDIRAIRKVYKLPVKRENAIYDDTCRRDFPMNKLQNLMYFIGKMLKLLFIGFLILSLITFVSTLIYLLVNKRKSKEVKTSYKKPMMKTKHNLSPRGYLWHDEIL